MRSQHKLIHFVFLALLIIPIGIGVGLCRPRARYLGDFGSFLASGRALNNGENPYAEEALLGYLAEESAAAPPGLNLNPPVLLPLFQIAARFDPAAAFRVWYFLSLLCYLATLALLWRLYRPSAQRLWWSLALAGLWYALGMGQIYTALALMTALAWTLLARGKQGGAGILIGLLVAIKPNFLVWPALLLLSGAWVPALAAGLTTLVLSLVPLVLYGPTVYTAWYAVASAEIQAGIGNASLPAVAARVGLPAWGAPVAALLLILLAAWAWSRRPAALEASAAALVGALLAGPMAWIGYTLLLLPFFLARPWGKAVRLAAGLLVVPWPLLVVAGEQSAGLLASLGFVYPLALLLVLAALLPLPRLARSPQPAPDPSLIFRLESYSRVSGRVKR